MLDDEDCGALVTDVWRRWASLLGVVLLAILIIKDYRDYEEPIFVNWPETLMAYIFIIVMQFMINRILPQPIPQEDDNNRDVNEIWVRPLFGLFNWFRRPFRILAAIRGVRL